MGLGIHMLAEVKRRGLRGRRRSERLVGPVAEALRAAAARAFPELGPFAAVLPGDGDETLVRLHPADEEVRLSAVGDRILLSARTNGGGPGYHAFLVTLMDEIAAEHDLRWLAEAQEGDNEYNDETGFFVSRQVDALKEDMAGWLVSVAAGLTEEPSEGNVYLVSMPLGTPIVSGMEGVMTPMGCISLEWLRETADASGADMLARASAFFPWWEPGVHAQAKAGVGRTALGLFPWHPPVGDEETALANVALACLGSAPAMSGLGGEISRRDVEELAAMIVMTPEDGRPPLEDGFGFMRRNVKRNPFPGCTLDLPGYFYEEDDDDGRAKVYWFGDRVVRVVSWLVTGGGPDAETPRELVDSVSGPGPERGTPAHRFDIEAPPLRGHCVLLEPAEGKSTRQAHAVFERPGRMLLLTLTYAKPSDAAWAELVVRSVSLLPSEGA